MTKHARVGLAGVALAAVAAWVASVGATRAAPDDAVKGGVQKLADALEKGDADAAKKQATDLAKEDLHDFMHLFKLRSKQGFGVGAKADVIQPDGIEDKLKALSKDGIKADQLEKESADLVKMAYVTAALASVALAKAPEKDDGALKRADWLKWAGEVRAGADELAKAAKAKKADDVKAIAAKIDKNCTSCHGVFRD